MDPLCSKEENVERCSEEEDEPVLLFLKNVYMDSQNFDNNLDIYKAENHHVKICNLASMDNLICTRRVEKIVQFVHACIYIELL